MGKPVIKGKMIAGRNINQAEKIIIINVEEGRPAEPAEPAKPQQDINIATHRRTVYTCPGCGRPTSVIFNKSNCPGCLGQD